MDFEVLVVDDDKMVSLLHSKAISISGIHNNPKIFYNGLEAFDFVKSEPNSRYVVLLDINMPVMDGWDFLDKVAEELPSTELAVIIVTSSIDKSDKVKANTYSVIKEFVEKPLTVNKVKSFEDNPELAAFLKA